MKKTDQNYPYKIKNELFPPSLFGVCFGVLILMSGLHTNVIVIMNKIGLKEWVQPIFPILYWFLVAAGLTLFIRRKMKKTYEEPLHRIAEATKKVAGGDFSVYVPTIHTSDKLDYLDLMILDFDKMIEELGSVETLKTDFVSNVSHEMKTPVAVIKNYAELLEKRSITEDQRREYAASIRQAAGRLSDLITNILRLNKLENQTICPEVEIYDLCGQLEECILNYENIWDEKDLELDVELEDRAYVQADRSLMELVWNNLLSNAAKFTDKGGTVKIRQSAGAGLLKVAVSDSGCGMSEESRKHIFDKFYQGDTSHAKEGNGLGLTLAKRVIELMDGDITVISEEGKGSTFIVTLPQSERKASGESAGEVGKLAGGEDNDRTEKTICRL